MGRDDGVGVYVARALAGVSGWLAIPAGLALENALGLVERERPELLVFVDAADMGLPPGSFRRLPLAQAEGMLGSSHALPLGFLAGMIQRAVREVLLVGVQPADLSLGEGLSPDVKKGADELAALLKAGKLDEIPS